LRPAPDSIHSPTVRNSSNIFIPVVLSGGSGTRLWPASRLTQPKQLLPLVDDRSMLQATIDRVAALGSVARPIIVTNKDHAEATARELSLSGYPDATLILEPVGRNTAAAVAVAAIEAMKGGDPLMLVLPADHTIGDEAAFRDAVSSAAKAAESGYLVTFGITPSRPETGYGYVRVGELINPKVMRLAEFKEKPDERTAEGYIASGDYLWNSGMFLFKASRYLEELEQHAPDILASSTAASTAARRDGNQVYLDPIAFGEARSDSIDYAVMEKTSRGAVVPTDPGWNDVGSWASLWDMANKDAFGNVLIGDTVAVDTSNSYIRGYDRLVATVGLEDVIVVETPDAVLVAHRDSAQDVRAIVELLGASGRPELRDSATTLRPWGRFRTIDTGPGFRVLHLWVNAGGRTSLKKRTHRSTNVVVIRGVARITTGDTSRLVPSNESIYIPAGEMHRLENPGEDMVELIVVNSGGHAEEDGDTLHADVEARKESEG
jgi:mannose-1-phosphate guanylyltransferase/mannose-6-phosphate isomerase